MIGIGMILGIGIDLVEISRIADALDRYGERFLARVFTHEERLWCAASRNPAPSLAARFAAKEAAAKALGTGISAGIGWQHLAVHREAGQPPRMVFSGPAAERAAAMGVRQVHLSLTHTDRQAQAMVLLDS